MKIKNTILALGLAIALSFNFSTTLSATTADIPTIEDGVTGVIDEPIMDNNSNNLIVQLKTTNKIQLDLVSANGQIVWSTKTNNEIVSIPLSGYSTGTYTLIARDMDQTQFFPIYIPNNNNTGNITPASAL